MLTATFDGARTRVLALAMLSGLIATHVAAEDCHPSYEGQCVPIASDVDCEGGSGDGPAYVQGPFWVVGQDVYRLDKNRDGIACEE
jgi:hypothetical protein